MSGQERSMNVKNLVWVAMLMTVGHARAAENVAQVQANAAAVVAERTTDRKTGLEIRVHREKPQSVVVEVADRSVSVRKEMRAGESVATFVSGGDEIRLITRAGGVQVQENNGPAVLVTANEPVLDAMAAVLKRSPAARAGLALLSRLDLSPATPVGNTLLLTQALLEVPIGVRTAVTQSLQWSKEVASNFHMPRVRLAAAGPGECWDEYAKYVTEIWDDYGSCYFGCRWYQVLCPSACEFVWLIRAQLAFDWLIGCSGGLPVR
jgi:hypothetical protein